jgi:hypothetical protein
MIRSCRRHGKLGHEIVDRRPVAGVDGDLDRIEQRVDTFALRRASLHLGTDAEVCRA